MKFLIEIAGNNAQELIRALDEARSHLLNGGCFLNVGGCTDVKMRPEDLESEEKFRHQYAEAHPKPSRVWPK